MKKPITCLLILPFIISCRSPKAKSFCYYLFTNGEYYIDHYYTIKASEIPGYKKVFTISPLDEGELQMSIPTFHVLDDYFGVVNLTTKYSFFDGGALLDEVEADAPDFFSKQYRVFIDHADSDWWSVGLSDKCYVYYTTGFNFGFKKPFSFFDRTITIRIDFALTYADGSYYDKPCYTEFTFEHRDGLTYIYHDIPDFQYITQ
ncbi:MAG: hypothetical protein LBR37_03145 [Erysipelotrichaceae bacterium]|jgi:hypothetical protein|nr:hypothetical protein [Erysipelotrichaceae bacterium]